MSKNAPDVDVDKTIARLADPSVNMEVAFASTSRVARDIIRSLPGVRRLRRGGPEIEKALLALLDQKKTLKDPNLTAITLDTLGKYPSAAVKTKLAELISGNKFRGINQQIAAETFLKAAGIPSSRETAVDVAHDEAKKLQPKKPTQVKVHQKPASQVAATYLRKKTAAVARKKVLAAKK